MSTPTGEAQTDEDRNQLLDEFWGEVTDGLTVDPAYVEHLHRMRPKLPETPTTEQLRAWIQLADLVQDVAFRNSVRQFFHSSFPSAKAVELTTPQRLARLEEHRKLELRAWEAERSGMPPESPRAREIAEGILASLADLTADATGEPLGEQEFAELRRSMIHPDPDCAARARRAVRAWVHRSARHLPVPDGHHQRGLAAGPVE